MLIVNVKKENAIMIGDCIDADVRGAMAFGMQAILFDEKEISVLKSLRINKTPLEISKDIHTPRSTVYVILEKLKKRGLVKSEKLHNKKYWFLRKTSDETPDLHFETKLNPNIKVYMGKEGVMDFLTQLTTSDHIKFQALNGDKNVESWNNIVGIEQITKFNNIIKENNLISDIISSHVFIKENKEVLGETWQKSFTEKPTEYHILDSRYTNYGAQIILKKGKVFILNMKESIIFEIKNEDIYKCFTSIFEFIKDNSKKVNVGSLVKE